MDGTSGPDILLGGPGDDILNGLDGDDTLDGAGGSDQLNGGSGDDLMTDLVGDNVFVGGVGSDTIRGGAGADRVVILLDDDGRDNVDLGAGWDFVEIGDPAPGRDTTLTFDADKVGDGSPLGADGEFAVSLWAKKVSLSSFVFDGPKHRFDDEGVTFHGGGFFTTLGTAGDDVITAFTETPTAGNPTGAYRNNIYGGQGDDRITGGASIDNLFGGLGNDVLHGGAGNDFIDGGAGDDVLFGDAGNDDELRGGAGNDILWAEGSSQILRGGLGDDVYQIQTNSQFLHLIEATGEGVDTIVLLNNLDGFDLPSEFENLTLTGQIRYAGGNALDNVLRGDAVDNVLIGRGGNDYMAGGAGNDVYEVAQAGDIVFENPGEGAGDTVFSTLNDYTLTANVETLSLQGAAVIGRGNDQANALLGNAGDNALFGGGGDDYMAGGKGNDVYEVSQTGDVVVENAGEGDGDTVFASASYVLPSNVETLVLLSDGTVGVGNAAANTLIGGAGSQSMSGGAGGDVLVGGAGADLFWLIGADAGRDIVTDFTDGEDRVVLDHTLFANFASVQQHMQQVGADVLIEHDGATAMLLQNVQLANLSAADFLFY